MKYTILSVDNSTNWNITTECEIREDDGTLVYKGPMNFATTGTEEIALTEIELGMQNKYQQIMNERNAKLAEVAQSLIGKEQVIE